VGGSSTCTVGRIFVDAGTSVWDRRAWMDPKYISLPYPHMTSPGAGGTLRRRACHRRRLSTRWSSRWRKRSGDWKENSILPAGICGDSSSRSCGMASYRNLDAFAARPDKVSRVRTKDSITLIARCLCGAGAGRVRRRRRGFLIRKIHAAICSGRVPPAMSSKTNRSMVVPPTIERLDSRRMNGHRCRWANASMTIINPNTRFQPRARIQRHSPGWIRLSRQHPLNGAAPRRRELRLHRGSCL
jgi:hypothetical protein